MYRSIVISIMARTKNENKTEKMVTVRWINKCFEHILTSSIIDGNFTVYSELLDEINKVHDHINDMLEKSKEDRIAELKRELALLEDGVIEDEKENSK